MQRIRRLAASPHGNKKASAKSSGSRIWRAVAWEYASATSSQLPAKPYVTKTTTLPSGSQWLHEIKHDGFRIIARKTGTQVRLYSRPGNDLTRRFPLIVETLARRSLSGQPGHADVGPGWLQLGVRNARSSFGVSNAFTLVQKIDAALRGAAVAR
jgi:hypothetical protein